MNRYNLYCTEEQTKKAYELGAPIEILPNYTEYSGFPLVKCKDGNERPCIIPTAEQMIGWLEEQKNIRVICIKTYGDWGYQIDIDSFVFLEKNGFACRKEATLAAIDAALEYLMKEKLS